MKIYIFLAVAMFAICYSTFGQCPPSGLKIQTPICDSPKNLQVSAVTCKELFVQWRGNKNQKYTVTAEGVDPATSKAFETKASRYSCDDNGNCAATIPVKEGAIVNWSVESVCNIEGSTLYSNKLAGPQAYIPVCQKPADSIKNTVRVYPNPSTGILTVEYTGKITGGLEFNIFDMNGKMVFHKPADATLKTSTRYQLDLHNLISGMYLLEVKSGKDISRVKFVLFSN